MTTDEELVSRFPGEPITHDNKAHYRGRLARQLLINRCADCGEWHHPPRSVCPSCWSENVAPIEVGGSGTIHLAVLLHQGPPAEGVDYNSPYPVVTVELDDAPGVRFTTTVIDAALDQAAIGRRVQLDWAIRRGSPMPVFRLSGNVQ